MKETKQRLDLVTRVGIAVGLILLLSLALGALACKPQALQAQATTQKVQQAQASPAQGKDNQKEYFTCAGVTKIGEKCKRHVKQKGGYCWMHLSQKG